MSWETSVLALFEDLEQQAAGLHLVERDAEVADLSAAAYAQVTLAARLHASVGCELRVRLRGGQVVGGRLARVGEDWLLLVDRNAEWIVRTAGLLTVTGLSARADSEGTWSVVDRLSLRSVLRGLAGTGDLCLVHFVDDQQVEGRITRVGQDFFEMLVGQGGDRALQVVAVHAVAALQGRSP